MLSDRRWRLVHRLGMELLEIPGTEDPVTAGLAAMLQVAPADVAGDVEVHGPSGAARVVEAPDLLLPTTGNSGLEPVLATNPAIPYLLRHRMLPASRVEDLCSPEDWSHNAMRHDVLEPNGVPFAIICGHLTAGGVVRGWGLNRSRPFGDSDRDALQALHPFLRRAAADRFRRALVSELDHLVAEGAGLMLFRGSRPMYVNSEAAALLDRHQVPARTILRHCRTSLTAAEPSGSLVTGRGLLRLRLRPASTGFLAVVIDEAVPVSGSGPMDVAISPRQHAVLCYLSRGFTAGAIAHHLGVSTRTVHKHLENLYRLLGATDRLDAVLKARARGLVPVLQGCDALRAATH